MAFFRLKTASLPATSYGYSPPAGATAHGWVCADIDCRLAEHEAVRRWPKQCRLCGASTDPLFDEPWEHDARGVELQWYIRHHPERGGGYHQDQWQVWQVKDALLRGDTSGAATARSTARAHAVDRMQNRPSWGPDNVFFYLVWHDLDARDLDGAANDLLFWLGMSSADDVENNYTNRSNSQKVVDLTAAFIGAGGESHPQAQQIRSACLKIAEDSFQVLNRGQQAFIVRLARA